MVKRILFILISTASLYSADKRVKIETAPVEALVSTFDYLSGLPDEIAMNIPLQFIYQKSYESMKDLISLSRVSPRWHALVHDSAQPVENLSLMNSSALLERTLTLNHQEKIALLDRIGTMPQSLQAVACDRLAGLKPELFPQPINHPLIARAIERSHYPLFQSCYRLFKIAQHPDAHIGLNAAAGLVIIVTKLNIILNKHPENLARLQMLYDDAEKIKAQFSSVE